MRNFLDVYARASSLALATGAMLVGGAALAQTALVSPSPDLAPAAPVSNGQDGLQEIVVTAQKRSQNVQDTPLSVTALAGTSLAAKSITTVQELNRIDPALQIGHASGVVTTFIRGVGNPVTTAGNEASVPVYIDDVYFVRASYPFFSLGSVERVEVLKGPQGTLFGRNASGGVISIYTRDPSDVDPEMSGKVGYGNYDTVSAQLYVNQPVAEGIAANLAVDVNRQDDGWGRDINTGLDTYREHHVSLRGKLLLDVAEGTTIKLIGYYQKSYNEQGAYNRAFPGTRAGYPDGLHNGFPMIPGQPSAANPQPILGFYDTNTNFNLYDRSRGYGGSVRLDQELGFANFVSITALRRNKELYYSEGDYSPVDQLRYQLHTLDRQFSQEFQLKSNARSKVSWVLGAFYLNALQGYNPTDINGLGPKLVGVDNVALLGRQRIKSYAGFGQITYPISPDTNVTGGLRYTVDKLAGLGRVTTTLSAGVVGPDPVDLPPTVFTASKTFKKWTYKASIDHHFGRDVMMYASYSRGYKAGTFNTLPLDSAPLEPEVVDAYEIGLKTELFDRRLRLNGALFWNDISNPQVQAQRNGLVALVNAGSARTRGAEIDATAIVARGLTLTVGATYLDAKFRDFRGAPSYCPSPVISNDQCRAILTANGASPELVASVGNFNLNQIFIDASGNRMPYASKLKLSAGASYTFDLGGFGTASLDGSLNYASRFNWDSDNVIKEPAHTFFDAAASISPADLPNLSFRFWMKNITGVHNNIAYFAIANNGGYLSAPGAPRTFGGEIGFKF